ncbi:MAG: hypothetical protein KGZ81_03725 [Flavobacteriales bacterium]|nr:hypothetical protein [Flavobacteriales bacterium]
MEKPKTELQLIIEFLKSRFLFPIKSVAFILYFITIIVVVGLASSSIGLLGTIDLSKNFDINAISLSLIGYSLVLLCSSAIEFIFIGFKDDEAIYHSLKNPISMLGISAIIFGIFLSIIALNVANIWFKLSIGVLMTIGVWFMWWISNSRTLSVLIDYPPKVPDTTGGIVTGSTEQLQGTITSEYTS